MTKRLFIKTYGCQMNVYDSARMAELLAPLGYAPAAGPDGADLVILNTCHIREKAAEKVFSELGAIRRLKTARERRGGHMVIAVAGCVAQAEGEEILARAPFVDLVFGPQTYHRLPEMLAEAERSGGQVLDTSFPAEPKFDYLPATTAPSLAPTVSALAPTLPSPANGGGLGRGPSGEAPGRGRASPAPGITAFLTVQEGCDKFCTFCVVPYTRGAEFSRPADAVIAEARRLVANGAREITLLGQNVNAYHGAAPASGSAKSDEWRLGELIRALSRIQGLARLRYTTSHPRDVDDSLVAAHRDVPELMPFLHLPVQSGSDRVLNAMNRKHTADQYRRTVERLRRARPDLALSSDFIVGFPGESEADFRDTLHLVQEVGFAQAFSFKYSPRPGTPAASAADQVPEPVKAERLAELQALLQQQQRAFNAACVGRIVPVLFEKPGRHDGQLVGRSPYLQAVHAASGPGRIGDIVSVMIHRAEPNSLAGGVALEEPALSPTANARLAGGASPAEHLA